MSNLFINIRFLYWHYQLDFNLNSRFSFNVYRWEKPCQRWKSIIPPIAFYEFNIPALMVKILVRK